MFGEIARRMPFRTRGYGCRVASGIAFNVPQSVFTPVKFNIITRDDFGTVNLSNNVVQSKSAAFGNSTSTRTVTLDNNVTAGNLVVVSVSCFGPTVTLGVTDAIGGGQTYSQAGGYALYASNNAFSSIWYFQNSGAGACTVSVAPSATAYLSITVTEYKGMATSSVLDTTVTASSAGSTSPHTASIGAANELIVANYAQNDATLVDSVASPLTMRGHNVLLGTTEGQGNADGVVTGSITPTFNVTPSVAWGIIAASFKAATTLTPPIDDRITIPREGWYYCVGNANWTGTNGGSRAAQILLTRPDGSTSVVCSQSYGSTTAGGDNGPQHNPCGVAYCCPGDYIQLLLLQDLTASIDTFAPHPDLTAVYLY